MRVICPHANHPFNIPDDFVGPKILCPQCQLPIYLDRNLAHQIQEGEPAGAVPKDADNLAEKIYDGLPPLSVMLALRRQGKAYDADDLPSKYEMTRDDWKALDAFESLLKAAYGLHTTLAVGAIAVAANLPLLAFAAANPHVDMGLTERYVACAIGAVVFLMGCSCVFYFGSLSLQQARSRGIVDFLSGAICVALLIFSAGAAYGIYGVVIGQYHGSAPFFTVLSIPFNLIGVFELARTFLRVSKALKQIEPPEITNRLVEALKYLE